MSNSNVSCNLDSSIKNDNSWGTEPLQFVKFRWKEHLAVFLPNNHELPVCVVASEGDSKPRDLEFLPQHSQLWNPILFSSPDMNLIVQ